MSEEVRNRARIVAGDEKVLDLQKVFGLPQCTQCCSFSQFDIEIIIFVIHHFRDRLQACLFKFW